MKLQSIDQVAVVTYSISTSNHNSKNVVSNSHKLWLILFLHQTTTRTKLQLYTWCCDLFYFYIKPQPGGASGIIGGVVTYSISTSNHNACNITHLFPESYVVLRQTKRSVRVADEVRLMHFFWSYRYKYTKKILIVEVSKVLLAQLCPKNSVFRHTAYL